MASSSSVLLLFFFILGIATPHGILAVEYSVTNTAPSTAGGARFDREIGAQYTLQAMTDASNFIWTILQQNNPADRKPVGTVGFFVDDMDGIAYTDTSNNQIHYSASSIEGITGDVINDFTGVIYHEMTHVWQWSGPSGLIEGIADYVRLKAGYVPGHWVGPGGGDRWDQGYDVTARFLDYCDSLSSGFVAELNKRMRNSYNDSYFVDLLGKTVDQLWADYKATYN